MKTNNKTWIMNAQGVQLVEILNECCTTLDEFMQLAGDVGKNELADEFMVSYAIIENYLKIAQKQKLFSTEYRNHIRMEMKHCLGQADFYC